MWESKKAKVENVGSENSKIKRPFNLFPHFPFLYFLLLRFIHALFNFEFSIIAFFPVFSSFLTLPIHASYFAYCSFDTNCIRR